MARRRCFVCGVKLTMPPGSAKECDDCRAVLDRLAEYDQECRAAARLDCRAERDARVKAESERIRREAAGQEGSERWALLAGGEGGAA